MKSKTRSLSVYFAGELFNLKHLIGNAYIAEAIYEKSHGKYLCVLPQDLHPKGGPSQRVRDQDLRALLGCDLALFNFDGADLDSGTVVEFMVAKFADIPSVVLRTDRRSGGDLRGAWNVMARHYPRTVTLTIDGLEAYSTFAKRRQKPVDPVIRLAGQHSSADAQRMCDSLASVVVRALDRVRQTEPVMPKHLREEVYHWLPLMAGLRGSKKALRREFEAYLEGKVQADLL